MPSLLNTEDVKRRLRKQGVVLLTPYKNSNSLGKFKCQAGHTWSTLISNVLHIHSGCPRCYSERRKAVLRLPESAVQARLARRGITLIGPYVGSGRTHRGIFECKQGHTWKALVRFVLHEGGRCPICHPHRWGASESDVRKIVERVTGWSFPRVRPDWLRGRNGCRLELDGYNGRHRIAFEYQGKHHYEQVKFGNRSVSKLGEIRKKDERKGFFATTMVFSSSAFPTGKNVEGFIKKKLAEFLGPR